MLKDSDNNEEKRRGVIEGGKEEEVGRRKRRRRRRRNGDLPQKRVVHTCSWSSAVPPAVPQGHVLSQYASSSWKTWPFHAPQPEWQTPYGA